MDNATLLYVGMFCFAMMGLGIGLTVYEFKKISPSPPKSALGGAERKENAVRRTVKVVEIS